MPVYFGKSGPCHWAYLDGDLDDAEFGQFIARLRSVGAAIQDEDVILDLIDTPMPSSVQRKQISDTIVAYPRFNRMAGHALVARKPLLRGLMTALNWVIRPAFDEKIFANPQDALGWLAEKNGAADAEAIWCEINEACPELGPVVW